MTITNTQEVFKPRAVKPVSLNPSIMEGEKLITSLLGPSSALEIERYASTNLIAPIISGIDRIPSTLVCFPGVWEGSPRPAFSFQWLGDGVAIPGETNDTLTTDPSQADVEFTCSVLGENILGFEEVLSSNSIIAKLVEPINVLEEDIYVISGLGAPSRVTTFNVDTYVISGLGIESSQSVFSFDVYIVTFSE